MVTINLYLIIVAVCPQRCRLMSLFQTSALVVSSQSIPACTSRCFVLWLPVVTIWCSYHHNHAVFDCTPTRKITEKNISEGDSHVNKEVSLLTSWNLCLDFAAIPLSYWGRLHDSERIHKLINLLPSQRSDDDFQFLQNIFYIPHCLRNDTLYDK